MKAFNSHKKQNTKGSFVRPTEKHVGEYVRKYEIIAKEMLRSSNEVTNSDGEYRKLINRFRYILTYNDKSIKFFPGIVRLYLNGEFKNDEITSNFIKKMIEVIKHDINKYDYNLNNLSVSYIINDPIESSNKKPISVNESYIKKIIKCYINK